jgi:lipoate-protein ligase A
VQYNAIMLVRILADNPGKSFTKNLDAKFVATVKELLRDGRDMSVQQILRETLESFETQKSNDENLAPLTEMWKKEKQRLEKSGGAVR